MLSLPPGMEKRGQCGEQANGVHVSGGGVQV